MAAVYLVDSLWFITVRANVSQGPSGRESTSGGLQSLQVTQQILWTANYLIKTFYWARMLPWLAWAVYISLCLPLFYIALNLWKLCSVCNKDALLNFFILPMSSLCFLLVCRYWHRTNQSPALVAECRHGILLLYSMASSITVLRKVEQENFRVAAINTPGFLVCWMEERREKAGVCLWSAPSCFWAWEEAEWPYTLCEVE